nr:MAG TPA: hypothetical protein [Caudoviricetes sp.]
MYEIILNWVIVVELIWVIAMLIGIYKNRL